MRNLYNFTRKKYPLLLHYIQLLFQKSYKEFQNYAHINELCCSNFWDNDLTILDEPRTNRIRNGYSSDSLIKTYRKEKKPDNPHIEKNTQNFSATPFRVTGGKCDTKKMFSE